MAGRTAVLISALVAVAVMVSPAGAGAATTSQPIGPHQHFIGLVNGMRSNRVVYTVCGGPAGSSRTGPVASGQTMSVERTARGQDDTGLFSQIYAWFVPPAGGPRPTSLTFTTYHTEVAIPTSIQVPCDGNGKVEFSSCPYLAPCAAGWVPEIVGVRFVNIAV